MKVKLTWDVQDMIISLERIDVDYKRLSDVKSKEIVGFILDIIPKLSPRVLTVLVRDIESEKEKGKLWDYDFDTISNWDVVETKIVEFLDKKYGIKTTLKGLYTEFSHGNITYEHSHELEIPDEKVSEYMRYMFDYAFPRMSGIVYTTKPFILEHKEYLTTADRDYMIKCIKDEKMKWDNEDSSIGLHSWRGGDLNEWVKMLDEL